MILITIGFIIMLIGLINLKKGYYMFLVYQIYALGTAEIVNIEGFPTITIEMLMSAWFVGLFLIKRKKYQRAKNKMPYQIPICLIFISMFVTCFTGVAGFFYDFTRMLSVVLTDFSTVWLTWYLVETEQEFKYLIRWYTVIFFVAAMFGFTEYFLQTNYLVSYKSILKEGGIDTYSMIDGVNYRSRGYRMMSVFEHCIGAGMTMGLYSVLIIGMVVSDRKIPRKQFAMFTAIICLPCVFLTKMRSAMLFTFLAAVSVVDFKKKKFMKVAFVTAVLILVSYPLWSEYLYLIISLFNQKMQSSAGGSNLTMRLEQFEAVKQLMMMSPIGGLGEKFSQYISNKYTSAALGYESIWFQQMVKHGLLGVITYIFFIIYSVVIIPRKYKSKEVFWIMVAYWVTNTVTSIPSFRSSFFYFILFYYIKHSKKYGTVDKKVDETKVITAFSLVD
jgi:hypothetical protein